MMRRRGPPLRKIGDTVQAVKRMLRHHDDDAPVGFIVAVRYAEGGTMTLSNGDTHGLMNVVRDSLKGEKPGNDLA